MTACSFLVVVSGSEGVARRRTRNHRKRANACSFLVVVSGSKGVARCRTENEHKNACFCWLWVVVRAWQGPERKDLDNSQYFRTPSCAVGYSLYLGTTSDDTICLSFLIPTHMFFMIFYLMLFITISLDLFHLKHSFSIYLLVSTCNSSLNINFGFRLFFCLTQLSK